MDKNLILPSFCTYLEKKSLDLWSTRGIIENSPTPSVNRIELDVNLKKEFDYGRPIASNCMIQGGQSVVIWLAKIEPSLRQFKKDLYISIKGSLTSPHYRFDLSLILCDLDSSCWDFLDG